jgi:hypothetical protein
MIAGNALAVLAILLAAYCGIRVFGITFTIGDASGIPPAQTPEGQQWIRQLSHEGDLWARAFLACFAVGSLSAAWVASLRYPANNVLVQTARSLALGIIIFGLSVLGISLLILGFMRVFLVGQVAA